jgi:hypothetical protein
LRHTGPASLATGIVIGSASGLFRRFDSRTYFHHSDLLYITSFTPRARSLIAADFAWLNFINTAILNSQAFSGFFCNAVSIVASSFHNLSARFNTHKLPTSLPVSKRQRALPHTAETFNIYYFRRYSFVLLSALIHLLLVTLIREILVILCLCADAFILF